MYLPRNFKSKQLKRILLLVSILAIFLEVGILLSMQVISVNLSSPGIFKISMDNPLELPQECLHKTKDGYKWSCFRDYFETLTSKLSVNAAMAEAIRLKNEGATSDCHLFAHYIGEDLLENDNFDLGKSFSTCVAGCTDGCFHGVMERYIRNKADLSDIASVMKNVCDSLGTSPIQKYRCVHGVGHGLFAHNYLSLKHALNVCKVFDRPLDCYGGILMENMDQYIELDLDENSLRKIIPQVCAELESIEPNLLPTCLYDITLGLMDYTGYDIKHTEEICEELPQQEHIRSCKAYIPQVIFDQQPSNI